MALQNAAVQGDPNNAGGGALLGSTCISNVLVNGTPIATIIGGKPGPSDASCYKGNVHCHSTGPTGSSSRVTAGGSPVHRNGDARNCGHICVGSSGNVLIG